MMRWLDTLAVRWLAWRGFRGRLERPAYSIRHTFTAPESDQ